MSEPGFQSFLVGRKDENAYCIRYLALYLVCTLDVDVEHQIMPALLCLLQEPLGRTIVIAENFGMFQEFAPADHLFEFGYRNEKIFEAVSFTAAGRARCVGDGKIQIGDQLADLCNERGFTRARGRRNDVNGAHSIFCTCSRDFSISAFIARPSSVILRASPATPLVFDSSVLASRFISWSRKSSFLPTSPLVSRRARKCATWVPSRTNSS